MKKRKKFHTTEELKESCKEYNDTCYLPKDPKLVKIKSNCWFDISRSKNIFEGENVPQFDENKKMLRARKYIFYPSKDQKEKLRELFKCSTYIYNETLKEIKKRDKFDTKSLNLLSLRSLVLDKRKKQKVNQHILDGSIAKAGSNYKSAITNLKNKNIKNFRIRYKKYHNTDLQIYLEPANVLKNSKISDIGEIKVFDTSVKFKRKLKITRDENFINNPKYLYIDKSFIIRFEHKTKNYYLINISEGINNLNGLDKPRDKFISLDPGIGPILSGISPNNCFVFGKDTFNKMKTYMIEINKTHSTNEDTLSKRLKLRNLLNMKIRRMKDDCHFKLINYLTSKFNKILIGDMSVQGIVKKVKSKGIAKMSKRVICAFSLYKFKERLKAKCEFLNIGYEEINEFYTSKMCSICGDIKHNLKLGEKVYKCESCKTTIDRDFNGARNIFHVSQIKRSANPPQQI